MITIRDQQVLLNDAGFSPGPIDGIWGSKSNKAYVEWRKDKYGSLAQTTDDIRGGEKLEGVHPDLIRVFKRAAASAPPFMILEGVRSKQRQKELVASGASKTMNSRHIVASNGFAHAVDAAPLNNGTVSWDWPLYYPLAEAIKEAAKAENVPIEWGGDWTSFKDGPHWQLPWKDYPGT